MSIQWYPGHMHKARKEMQGALPEVDVVIELLDARIPFSSENPMLGELIGSKPRLRVLTRKDLADLQKTQQWIEDLEAKSLSSTLAITTGQKEDMGQLLNMLKDVALPSAQQYKPRLAMIAGIPNVGKSTLINALTGRSVAKTGNEPAITRQQQKIRLNDQWLLCDTPGVLWPKVDNPASGYRLAATGAVRETAMNSAEVAASLLDFLIAEYPERLTTRYGPLIPLRDSLTALEAIGRLRGCLSGGALIDFDRVGRLILQDFRGGHLGRITLETPSMRDREIEETKERNEKIAEQRQLRKAARLKRRQAKKTR